MLLGLSRFSIRQQILIGFIPVLLILVFLAFSSFKNFQKFNQSFYDLKAVTKEGFVFLAIERDTVELQRNVLVYSYIGYNGVLRKIEFLQKKLEEEFNILKTIVQQDKEINDRFNRMLEHYNNYKKGFEEAVIEKNKIKKINNEIYLPLSKNTHAMLDRVTQALLQQENFKAAYQVSHIERELYQTSSYIDAFQKSPDSVLIKETQAMIESMREDAQKIIPGLGNQEIIKSLQEFEGAMEQYQSVFRDITRFNRSYLNLINVVLAGKAAEIDQLSKELDELITQHSQALMLEITDNIKSSQKQFIILSLFAGIIGLLSSIIIAMGISKPVSAMATTLSALSTGKADIVIPGQERKDEVGQMAKAANEFRGLTQRLNEQAQAIEESQAQLSAIVDNIVDGLITIDENGSIQTYNAACQEIFGFSMAEVAGKNVNILMPEPYHSEHDNYLKSYHKTSEKKIIGIGREVEGKRKDGSIFPIELSVSQVNVKGRKLYSGIVRDITEDKKEQEALISVNAELEEFAYRTSHDLRSPLVSSISLLSIVQKAITNNNDDKAQKGIEAVKTSLVELENLVKDILELTKIKNAEEEKEEINFDDIIDSALKKLTHMKNYDRLTINTQVSLLNTLLSKKSRVILIVENLISNAIKYQDTEKHNSFVKISVKDDDKGVQLIVEDNGLGIPEKNQKELFSMFKRFHPKASFGSGLGLYMMKKSVDILGGVIAFEDTGEGSKFTLTIPYNNQVEGRRT